MITPLKFLYVNCGIFYIYLINYKYKAIYEFEKVTYYYHKI